MSNVAIGDVTGVTEMQVRRDRAQVRPNVDPDRKITGQDGKALTHGPSAPWARILLPHGCSGQLGVSVGGDVREGRSGLILGDLHAAQEPADAAGFCHR
jgi:hypothetical protein